MRTTPNTAEPNRVHVVRQSFRGAALIWIALVFALSASAQTTDTPNHAGLRDAQRDVQSNATDGTQEAPSQPVICGPAHITRCLKDIVTDQAGIWTSPLHIRAKDSVWLMPFAAATAVAIHYDAKTQQELGVDRSRIDTSNTISQFGATYTLLGEGSALYAIGQLTHNDHLAETGRLGAEAVIDAMLVSEALKFATNRERPDEGNGTGGFWAHGTRTFSDSFPSGHAIETWAFARVVASEYPNTLTRVGVYAFATAISVSRVTSRRHFPSDSLAGSVLGYFIGGYVIRHHAADLGLSVLPVVDARTHAYGLTLAVRPSQLKSLNLLHRVH